MALVLPRIAPALLAYVAVTLLIAPLSARAETPAAPAADDCLARPNGPSAKGSHWYYRVDRPSGRHCWYQRPIEASQDEAKDAPREAPKVAPVHRHAAAASVAPPAEPAVPAASPPANTAAPSVDNGDIVVPPVDAPTAPIAAPTAAPYGTFGPGAISAAPPAAAPTPPSPSAYGIAQAPSASPAQVPVAPAEPAVATPQPPPDVAAPKPDLAPKLTPLRARNVSVPPHEDYADPPSHVPALFGAVSALVIIILGSYVGRLLGNRRVRRASAAARTRDPHMAVSPEPASASLAPIMAAADKAVVRERGAPRPQSKMSPDDWGVRRARKPRRAETPAAAPIREATRVLEDNVRDLLGRLQHELRGGESKPRRAASVPDAHAPTAGELDAVLAIWRARREAR
ncbi:MAG TPA: hypothetical protein VKX28_16745 [Xanthobacteraceae bacterium]|nr:hypothetical protein [Xanthobacteraceae bacterium]